MASVMFADLEEDVEAGNVTTTMMTNQTTDGNMQDFKVFSKIYEGDLFNVA